LAPLLEREWDWVGAEREFKRALELNPNYATAHHWYALHLSWTGRHEGAISEIKRAQELDPLSPIIHTAAAWPVYFAAKRYDEAQRALEKAFEIDPNFAVGNNRRGRILLQIGRPAEAVPAFEKAAALSGNASYALVDLAHGYHAAGREKDAARIGAELKKRAQQGVISAYDMALWKAGLGESQAALYWLEQAVQEYASAVRDLRVEPRWDYLQKEPRFQTLLRRLGHIP
jgi:tetratricopeptide (TPR) repeat protein